MNRRAYPSDVRDEEWALVLPYLTLTPLEAPQRKYDLREVWGALRWMVRTAAIYDARTLQSTPQSGERAGQATQGEQGSPGGGYVGPPAGFGGDGGQRTGTGPGGALSQRLQEVTGARVAVAFVDQGYTKEEAAQAAEAAGIALCVVKVEGAGRGFVLLPKRWFAWTSRFRRLARDYERLAETLRGWHWLAFSVLMTAKTVELLRTAS